MKFISKILLCVFLLSFQAFAREVNIIHITDINLNTNNAYKLQKTIKEINSYKNIDFVVFGGNNLAKPNIDNLNTFLYLLKKVHKKTYVLLGSTDVLSTSGINKEYYLKKVNHSRHFTHSTKPNYVFTKKGIVFVVMDGSKQYFQASNGYYSKNELLWLEKTLEKYKNNDVIILQHFPILPSSSQWLETRGIEDYEEIISKYKNIKMIISGHYGDNLETEKNGVFHIITESYSKNGAYKLIQIDLNDDFIGTYLVK